MNVIKTFDDLMSARIVRGFLFINEHFLANYLPITNSDKKYHLPSSIDQDVYFKRIIDLLDIYGYLTETDNVYLNCNAYHIVTDPTDGHKYCDYMVTVSILNGVVTVKEYKSGDTHDVTAVHDRLNEDAIKKPISISTIIGFENGRELKRPNVVSAENEPSLDVMYPTIKEGTTALFDGFKHSTNSAMLFIGEPGTGKSTLLRHLIGHLANDYKVVLLQDEQLFSHPEMGMWLSGIKDKTMVIIEDADTLLSKRKDGNKLMANLLNQLDGVVQRDVKFVFSTNLPSTRDVEPALLRSGRLYKTVEFTKLTADQIKDIARVKDIPCPDKENVVLAELFGDGSASTKSMGFI